MEDGRGGRVGKSRSLNPEVLGSSPTDAVSNLGQVRLPTHCLSL